MHAIPLMPANAWAETRAQCAAVQWTDSERIATALVMGDLQRVGALDDVGVRRALEQRAWGMALGRAFTDMVAALRAQLAPPVWPQTADQAVVMHTGNHEGEYAPVAATEGIPHVCWQAAPLYAEIVDRIAAGSSADVTEDLRDINRLGQVFVSRHGFLTGSDMAAWELEEWSMMNIDLVAHLRERGSVPSGDTEALAREVLDSADADLLRELHEWVTGSEPCRDPTGEWNRDTVEAVAELLDKQIALYGASATTSTVFSEDAVKDLDDAQALAELASIRNRVQDRNTPFRGDLLRLIDYLQGSLERIGYRGRVTEVARSVAEDCAPLGATILLVEDVTEWNLLIEKFDERVNAWAENGESSVDLYLTVDGQEGFSPLQAMDFLHRGAAWLDLVHQVFASEDRGQG